MNALPFPAAQALLPVQATQPGGAAAVLPPALLTVLAGTIGAPAQALPTFDRTLQQLLHDSALTATAAVTAATALPAAGDGAGLPVQDADTESAETGTDGVPDAGSALHFDPALASLLPQTAAVALAQASHTAQQAAPATPAAATPAGDLALAAVALPALPASPAPTAGRDPAMAALVARPAAGAGTPAAVPAVAPAVIAATAPTAAPAVAVAAPADTTALPLDRLTPASSLAVPPANTTAVADAADAARSGDAAPQGRAPSLLQTLGDRIAVQIDRGSERVVIRLDPPHRGQIEIHIRQDASGATQVQLSASHGDVVRQLHAIGDSLRQELAQRQGGDVSVQIAQQSRDPDSRRQQERQGEPQQQPGRALDDDAQAAEAAAAQRFALASDRP